MKKIIILILLITILLSANCLADVALVTRVIDGDTIIATVNNKTYKIRMIGINTPETVHPKKPIEYFGKEAKTYTQKHLLGKEVFLTYDWQKQDRYGRLLAYIWLESEMFNLKIIREGYAYAYLKYPFKEEYMKKFAQAQKYAQKNKKGLWTKK